MKTTRWLILLGLCLVCVSCAAKKHPDPKLWQIKSPVARVISMKVVEQTDKGFRVEAVVELDNENRVGMPLLDLHYKVEIDGVGSISLEDKADRTVPAYGKQQIVLPAAFAWDKHAPAGSTWHVSGKVKYRPPGELREIMTQTYIPLPDTYFKATGKLQ